MIRPILAGPISLFLLAAVTACDGKAKQETGQSNVQAIQAPAQAPEQAKAETEAQSVTGFGVADWGMDRNEIIAAEGTPDAVGDRDGHLMYFEREVMGKKARVIYQFEEGCSSLKSSMCKFSDGYYNFLDGSKEYSDELEKALTEKYGPPSSVREEIDDLNEYADAGRREYKLTISTRRVGKIKIEHESVFNLYDHTAFGELEKSGPVGNFVRYYGPYHYEVEMNKKKAEERGL